MSVTPPDYPLPSYPFQSPSLKPMTKELTTSKCNIWRACVKEATIECHYDNRPYSPYFR